MVMSKIKIPTNEEIKSFNEKIALAFWAQEEVGMEPNMEQVIKKIMSDAIAGNQESQKICVEMLIDKNTENKQLQDEIMEILRIEKICQEAADKQKQFDEQARKGAENYKTCNALKILVIDVLKHKDWTINDIKFSDKGNVDSINIKFASEFTLGNSPWDPR